VLREGRLAKIRTVSEPTRQVGWAIGEHADTDHAARSCDLRLPVPVMLLIFFFSLHLPKHS
jgi:hypothetical protein